VYVLTYYYYSMIKNQNNILVFSTNIFSRRFKFNYTNVVQESGKDVLIIKNDVSLVYKNIIICFFLNCFKFIIYINYFKIRTINQNSVVWNSFTHCSIKHAYCVYLKNSTTMNYNSIMFIKLYINIKYDFPIICFKFMSYKLKLYI